MRLDHLLSKEIPGPDEVRINLAVYRLLVVSFERVTVPQKVKISVVAYADYFSGAPETSFNTLSHPFGGDGGGEPRVPIPNTTVKPSSANGT